MIQVTMEESRIKMKGYDILIAVVLSTVIVVLLGLTLALALLAI